MIKAGADVYAVDSEGTSATHTAAFAGHGDCLRYIIEIGKDKSLNAKTRTQESSPLHFAAFKVVTLVSGACNQSTGSTGMC